MKTKVIFIILWLIGIFSISARADIGRNKITLPTCDNKNREVMFITKIEDWKHINDSNKTIFCVKAGDYSKLGRIILKKSGTVNKRRYIILDNGNNKHPVNLKKTMLAKVSFELQNTNYWLIDRMSYWDSNTAFIANILTQSDNNIFNRCYFSNVNGGAIVLHPDSDNNIIQNCRIERDKISFMMDRASIELNNNGKDHVNIINNKILNNDIVNAVDGIQLVNTNPLLLKSLNYEGTVIDSNTIHIDNKIYTNCKGVPQQDGQCAYAENAIDLKVGSLNFNNPIIISNNKMWGYRQADKTKSNLDDIGVILPIHYDVRNISIKDNVLFNSRFGLVMDTPFQSYSAENLDIYHNIFNNITSSVFYLTQTNNVKIRNNLFKKIGYGEDGKGKGTFSSFYFNKNTHISFLKNKIIHSFKPIEFYVKEKNYNGDNKKYYLFNKNIYFDAKYNTSNNSYEKSISILDKGAKLLTNKDKNPILGYKDLPIIIDKFKIKPSTIILHKVIP